MQGALVSHHCLFQKVQTVTQKVTTVTVLGTPKTSVSPLADCLVHPVQKTTPTAPKRSISRAKLLTSDESLVLLEQKENAKKWHF